MATTDSSTNSATAMNILGHKVTEPTYKMTTQYTRQTDEGVEFDDSQEIENVDITITKSPSIIARNFTTKKILLGIILVLILIVTVLVVVMAIRGGYSRSLCLTPECVYMASSVWSSMNASADPCMDYYNYACGGWLNSNPIPPGESQWSLFAEKANRNAMLIKSMLDELPVTDNYSSIDNAMGNAHRYYLSCMDKNNLKNKLGGAPLMKLIESNFWEWGIPREAARETGGNTPEDLTKLLKTVFGKLSMLYMGAPIVSVAVDSDEKNKDIHVIQIAKGYMTLDTNFYTNTTIDNNTVLTALLEYMIALPRKLGSSVELNDTMRRVLEFEMELANLSDAFPVNYTDMESNYRNMTISALQNEAPYIIWLDLLQEIFSPFGYDITDKEIVVVYFIDYLKGLTDLLGRTDSYIVDEYILFRFMDSQVNYLSDDLIKLKKPLVAAITGIVEQRPVWKNCLRETESRFPYVIGAMFVERTFDKASKEAADSMIDGIRNAFIANLPQLSWMDTDTSAKAVRKARMMEKLIGYPDFILVPSSLNEKYKSLDMKEDEFFNNSIKLTKFALDKSLIKLRLNTTDRDPWDSVNPASINAFYQPSYNEMLFPAGILQVPFYDKSFHKALNFGRIGVVVGHELTHGFDSRGRQYDAEGNLRRWWNNESIARFETQTKCMREQYSAYRVGNETVDGNNTLAENIADNGGLKSSFLAYRSWVKRNGQEKLLPALQLSNEQLFFLGFAQVWCNAATKEESSLQVKVDVHSPGKWRVVGSLSNSFEFSEAYSCPKGSPMNPVSKCVVW